MDDEEQVYSKRKNSVNPNISNVTKGKYHSIINIFNVLLITIIEFY